MGKYFNAHHSISIFNEFMNVTEQRIRSFYNCDTHVILTRRKC